jgi:hypothetical protein
MAKFEFNERAIDQLVQEAARKTQSEIERDLNQLSRQLEGQPIEAIKAALQESFRNRGGKITDPDLSTYAQAIQDGRHITVRLT